MPAQKMDPVHPGEILLEEFLKPMNLSQNRLALDIRVPARRINEIVHGKRRISADTALIEPACERFQAGVEVGFLPVAGREFVGFRQCRVDMHGAQYFA